MTDLGRMEYWFNRAIDAETKVEQVLRAIGRIEILIGVIPDKAPPTEEILKRIKKKLESD